MTEFERPERLILDLNEAAAALIGLPEGPRMAKAVTEARDLLGRLSLALEATTALVEKAVARLSAVDTAALDAAGFVIVPKEPTAAMIRAAASRPSDDFPPRPGGAAHMVASDYRIMIEARPK